MFFSIFNWFLGILTISIWVGSYYFFERAKVNMWFDNKFGKDDPMPPSPKQQEAKFTLGEGGSVTVQEQNTSNQKEL